MYVLLEYSFSSCFLSILIVNGELANHLRLSELEPAGTGSTLLLLVMWSIAGLGPAGTVRWVKPQNAGQRCIQGALLCCLHFSSFKPQLPHQKNVDDETDDFLWFLLLPTSLLKEVRLLYVEEGNWQVGFYSSLLIRA